MGDQRHRSFTGQDPDEPDAEPLTFSVDGEEFEAESDMPGSVFIGHLAGLMSGNIATQAAAYMPFLQDALGPDEYQRFRKFVDDPERSIRFTTITEIIYWLVGEYDHGRPTKRPSRSRRGRSTTGPTSAGDSSGRDSELET